jgi:precorrin-2 dehydrogenase / sirohydrochlorin ferrochelatase
MSGEGQRPYAVMLNVAGKLAVVVGGGAGAARSARALGSHGADVVVISPGMSEELLAMEADGVLTAEVRAYARGDLRGAFVAVVASGDPAIDASVVEEARASGVLVHLPGDADASDFIVPSVVRRGALQIAVTTGGGAPSVAREVRRGIAETYGPEWDAYTTLMAGLRTYAIERTGLPDARLAPLFEAIDAPEVRRLLVAGRTFTAEELFDQHGSTVTDTAGTDQPG